MRQLSLVVTSETGGFQQGDADFATSDWVTQVSIRNLKRLADGSVVILSHLRGDRDHIESRLSDAPSILTWDISTVPDGYYVYTRQETSDLADQLLAMSQEYELILDFPLVYRSDGGIQVTLIAPESEIRELLRATPDSIDIELERIEEYDPDSLDDVELTDRQRKVLRAAVEAGYYEIPRAIGREELAAQLDIAGGTLSEHLRKIEAELVSDYYGRKLSTPTAE